MGDRRGMIACAYTEMMCQRGSSSTANGCSPDMRRERLDREAAIAADGERLVDMLAHPAAGPVAPPVVVPAAAPVVVVIP